jgi:CubicO group peptidase (beta-lactamase class C family)
VLAARTAGSCSTTPGAGPTARPVAHANRQVRIGSMSKDVHRGRDPQLVEAHKLALDDPISKHLPKPNGEVAARSRCGTCPPTRRDRRHLGPRVRGAPPAAARAPRLPEALRQRALTLSGAALSTQLRVRPARRAIERVSRMSYDDYVGDHVFRRAGMASTGSLLNRWTYRIGRSATSASWWIGCRALPTRFHGGARRRRGYPPSATCRAARALGSGGCLRHDPGQGPPAPTAVRLRL